MSTIKISELPVITGANVTGSDVIPIVDVSLGTTNQITRDEFFKNISGNVGIGATNPTDRSLSVSKPITGGTTAYGIINNGTIQTDVTTAHIYRSSPSVIASHPTVTSLVHYHAAQGTIGAGSVVTSQVGFSVNSNMIGATTNVGFSWNGISAAIVTTGKTVYGLLSQQDTASGGGSAYNIYSNGTAPNYFAGSVGVGTTAPIVPLHVVGSTVTTGVVYKAQPAQTSKAAAATLTIADLLTGIVQYTGASATLTLPLGTAIEGGLPATFPTDMSFDVSFINTGSGTLTIGTAAGLTLVGAMTTLGSALLRFRKTAANAYTVYRIS